MGYLVAIVWKWEETVNIRGKEIYKLPIIGYRNRRIAN